MIRRKTWEFDISELEEFLKEILGPETTAKQDGDMITVTVEERS